MHLQLGLPNLYQCLPDPGSIMRISIVPSSHGVLLEPCSGMTGHSTS